MNTASKELCKELYELSKWDDTDNVHYYFGGHGDPYAYNRSHFDFGLRRDHKYDQAPAGVVLVAGHKPASLKESKNYIVAPAYSAGYLLRKLPHQIYIRKNVAGKGYTANLCDSHNKDYERGATPEDALCSLAIELIKAGVIQL